jgi:aldehyde decarbonylase
MPLYDYVYNTMDKSSDELYERSLKGTEETPELVHLTHMTTLESAYHLRIGIASIASKPSDNSMLMWMLWPLAWLSMVLAWVYGSSAFVVERIKIKKMKMQTWAIPRYNFQVNGCFYWLCLYMMVCKVLTVFVITVWPELGERVNQRLN